MVQGFRRVSKYAAFFFHVLSISLNLFICSSDNLFPWQNRASPSRTFCGMTNRGDKVELRLEFYTGRCWPGRGCWCWFVYPSNYFGEFCGDNFHVFWGICWRESRTQKHTWGQRSRRFEANAKFCLILLFTWNCLGSCHYKADIKHFWADELEQGIPTVGVKSFSRVNKGHE